MALRSQRLGSDRGAILVHVAWSLLAIMAFVAFTLDYGVLWASRGQAQNSADAGALAGAIALAFDDPSDLTDAGAAKQNAFEATQQNLVWGTAPNVNVATDVTFTCPPGVSAPCVRVDVYRNADRGNPLPTFFGLLFGRSSQDMRATATAHVGGANSARCMLPFMLSDRWEDNYDEFIDTGTYPNDGIVGIDGWSNNDHYQPGASPADVYRAPYPGVVNPTGWSTERDFGRQLILHDPVGTYSAGWAGIAQLPGLGTGADDYRDALYDCDFNNAVVAIAPEDFDCTAQGYPNDTTVEMGLAGCLSVKTGWVAGPSEQGVEGGGPVAEGLLQQDDDAVWNWGVNCGPNGEAGCVVKSSTDASRNMTSPRVRPLPIIDNTAYVASGCSGTGCIAKVVNIVGFFVEGMCDEVRDAGRLDPGNDCDPGSNETYQLVGRIVTLPGDLVGAGMPVSESSFVKTVRLIR